MEGLGTQQLLRCSVPPALLLAVPVSCPRAALGDPILQVLVQALHKIPWGTEGALLCWVLYKHNMGKKSSSAQAGKLVSVTGKGPCCTYWESNLPGWVLPKGKLDTKPIPKGESESRNGPTVHIWISGESQ